MTRRTPKHSFLDVVKAAGGEVLAPTNPYETMRFRTRYGVGVVYTGKRGETWNAEALAAKKHIENGRGNLSPVSIKGRRTDKATAAALLLRDGDECFFCGEPLGGDMTVEHLVAVCHGGPNHISNLFLAHAECNQRAGHLSAPEKVKMAIRMRSAEDATA